MNKNALKENLWKKAPALMTALLSVKNCKNERLQQLVRYRDSGRVLLFSCLGDKNRDKCIYLIRSQYENHGFFAIMNNLARLLCFADRFSLIPVVDNMKSPYYCDPLYYDGKDFFRQYFQQISDVSVAEAYQSSYVLMSNKSIDGQEWIKASYLRTDEEIEELAVAWGKYIHLLPELQKEFDDRIGALLNGKKTLGVHIRGNSFKMIQQGGQHGKNHPIPLTIEQVISEVESIMNTNQFSQIFLATTDLDYYNQFSNAFHGMVVGYCDVERVAGTVDAYDATGHTPYEHGKEVLLDAMTLAACDGLVAGLSQVSLGARIINRASGKPYGYVNIISNGLNV